MKKNVTLKENRDFHRLYKKGKSFVGKTIVTYVLKNNSAEKRLGITTGKKIGNAVKRSRSRRIIRASYFNLYESISDGYDIVFVARGKCPYVKSTVVQKEMSSHLQSAEILNVSGE